MKIDIVNEEGEEVVELGCPCKWCRPILDEIVKVMSICSPNRILSLLDEIDRLKEEAQRR